MMADRDSSRAKKERPHNREVENENLRPPATEGERPRPATEPPGSEESTRPRQIHTDDSGIVRVSGASLQHEVRMCSRPATGYACL